MDNKNALEEVNASTVDVSEYFLKKLDGNQKNIITSKLLELSKTIDALYKNKNEYNEIQNEEENIKKELIKLKSNIKISESCNFFHYFRWFLLGGSLAILFGLFIGGIIGLPEAVMYISSADNFGELLLGLLISFLFGVIYFLVSGGGIGIIALAIGIIVSFNLTRVQKLKVDSVPATQVKYNELANELKEKREIVKANIEQLEDKVFELSFIVPEKYCSSLALEYIADCISSYRAESMKEAFNLYEEQLHRWKLEEAADAAVRLQQQQMYIQQRQASELRSIRISSGISAAANTAYAFSKIF